MSRLGDLGRQDINMLPKWKWGCIVGLLVVGLLLRSPLNYLFTSVRLALSMQRLASGATGRDLAVHETRVVRRLGDRVYEALLYHPAQWQATSAVVLVAGISELGCYHPKLVAFSRFLADSGLLVITPDIEEFREFKISAEPIDQILFWYSQVGTLPGSERVQKTGLAGISYSGTLALIAAARPEIRDRVAFVVGIGSYCDLIRCTGGWFAAAPALVGQDHYPTRFYAKWIIMLSALDMVAAAKDRLFLHDVLQDLLLQKEIPPAGSDITLEGLRWYRLATMREDQSDPELAGKITEYLISNIYPQLDPKNALSKVHCPVFLIHGAYDDLIPPRESMELHRRLSRSLLLISPFLTHTHPTDAPLSLKRKAAGVLDMLVFSYRCTRVIL